MPTKQHQTVHAAMLGRLLWMCTILQISILAYGLLNFQLKETLDATRSQLGLSFSIARACALALHINTAIILLPVCRNLITKFRATALIRALPLDDNLKLHKIVGWTILILSWIHSVAHFVNFARIAVATGTGARGWIIICFTNGPSLTGWMLLGIITAMAATASEQSRSTNFERFWYTHHMFVVFFVIWAVHGSFCMITPDAPPFCRGTASLWKWLLFGGLLYMGERLLREFRGYRRAPITKVIQHPSRVCEIQISKVLNNVKAGQYIFLCCPRASLLQYHPFTLTSAPEEDFLSVHIRNAGDFTAKLHQVCGCDTENAMGPSNLPAIMIDGPFGSASEDVFKHEVVMLVGAGIGVTPFASILKSIWYRSGTVPLRKAIFYWICRDFGSFEWFRSLLAAIEEQDTDKMIEFNCFLTAAVKDDDAQNLVLNSTSDKDAITGLSSRVRFGRPDWAHEFDSLARRYPGRDIGVFFCGPGALANLLESHCNAPRYDKTRFVFGKENF
ncbi:hypothetical protein PYCC9005_000278 [Savitreella phatthalungensis]